LGRSKRRSGALTRLHWPHKGGRSAPQIHSVQAVVFSLLIFDALPYHRFVSTYGRDEVSSCSEVLPHKISLLLSVYTVQMDRALALDETDHPENRIFRWDGAVDLAFSASDLTGILGCFY
jgi:hypothetical protein